MKKIEVSRVCIVDTTYTLLLYFLISTEKEIRNTAYFTQGGIDPNILKRLSCVYDFKKIEKKSIRNIRNLFFQIFSDFYWPFLKSSLLFGQDHLQISHFLIKKRDFNLIEDGIRNYFLNESVQKDTYLKRTLFGDFFSLDRFGNNENTKRVYLTRTERPNYSSPKIIQFLNIKHLWQNSDIQKKSLIKNIFNIQDADLTQMSLAANILFTQPLSEDGIITEKEKIDLYKKLISNVSLKDVIIKTHPRETTNYLLYFPEAIIYSKQIPFEILSLINEISFEKVYTLFSGVVINFDPQIIVFAGTKCHPKIEAFFGKIELEDIL